MSRASRARSSAAPTAATAPATSCWARTVLATAARTSEPITTKLTTRAGVPASRASQPVPVSGSVPTSVRGAPREPRANVTVSTTRKRCGKSSPVSSAEHTTVRAAGCAVSTDTNNASVSAVSIMASSG